MPWESSSKFGVTPDLEGCVEGISGVCNGRYWLELSFASKSNAWLSGSAVVVALVRKCDSKFASDCWEALEGVGKETGRISTGIDVGAAEGGRSDEYCPDRVAVSTV